MNQFYNDTHTTSFLLNTVYKKKSFTKHIETFRKKIIGDSYCVRKYSTTTEYVM